MDVSTVRAEIKAWERSFKATNARDPTLQDIKLNPPIADKYKLYKKLSKFASVVSTQSAPSTSASASSGPPSTPPRPSSRIPESHSSLLLSKPRISQTTAPLSSFNPFSPQKNKSKQRPPNEITTESHSNPFANAVKTKLNPSVPSSNPFPLLQPLKPSSSSSHAPPAPTSAVSRARKRLRGEPVSPSPNKEKRRRMGSQATLPFTKLADSSSESDDSGDDIGSSFVTDSPVKAPAGTKSFKLLFDESSGHLNAGPSKGKLVRGQTKSTGGLFGERSTITLDSMEEDLEWELGDRKRKTGKIRKVGGQSSAALVGSHPKKQTRLSTIMKPKLIPPASDISDSRTSSKRSLSDTEMDTAEPIEESPGAGSSLLPPSPRPAEYRERQNNNTKGKGKAKSNPTGGRKKAKVADHQDVDESDDEEVNDDEAGISVKVIDPKHARSRRVEPGELEKDLGSDSDPILSYSRRAKSHSYRHPSILDVDDGGDDGLGKFEVDLPDKLRLMLALESAESKARDIRAERVFKGLLYGQRTTSYDPTKGGEIWDVGEDDLRLEGEDEIRRDTEGEEDWEGEPVPWEVGEL